MRFYGAIKDGKLTLDDRDGMRDWVAEQADKRVQVDIQGISKVRTPKQHGLYFGILRQAARQSVDLTVDELHQGLKQLHLTDTSGTFPRVGSTTTLSTVEMLQYINEVVKTLAEMDVQVDLPGDVL